MGASRRQPMNHPSEPGQRRQIAEQVPELVGYDLATAEAWIAQNGKSSLVGKRAGLPEGVHGPLRRVSSSMRRCTHRP